MDRSILEQAELAATYDAWQAGLLITGLLAALMAAISAVCLYQVNFAIPKRATELAALGDAALLQRPPSHWPKRLLLNNGWSPISLADDTGEIEVFTKASAGKTEGSEVTEAIFKSGEQTVVWAKAIALGETYIWPYAEKDDRLEDGTNSISVEEAVRGTGIADIVRQTESFPVDVIGVGLESSHGGNPDDNYRELSDRRGQRLVAAAQRAITTIDPTKPVSFRALGLGRAETFAARETETERRQRSVVIIVVSRMSNDTVRLATEEVLLNFVFEIPISAVDLSDYEYAVRAPERLSPSLVFDGSATVMWQVPKILPNN